MELVRRIDIHRSKLPHWAADEGTYFVTFRLFDSVPRHVPRKEIENTLDRGHGVAFLKRHDIGQMVFDALKFFHGSRYFLHSLCVMPNHVHVVFRTAPGVSEQDVLRSWKSYTAKEANRLLKREGRFWQKDSFDKLISDQHELERANAYVLANPEKAGLPDWPWVERYDTEWVVKYEREDGGRPEAGAPPEAFTPRFV